MVQTTQPISYHHQRDAEHVIREHVVRRLKILLIAQEGGGLPAEGGKRRVPAEESDNQQKSKLRTDQAIAKDAVEISDHQATDQIDRHRVPGKNLPLHRTE